MAEGEGEESRPSFLKRKRQPPELSDEVRMLAYVKRTNKPIYEMLEAEAQQLGMPKAKLLEEAISHYLIERKTIQKQMSVAELYEALQFLSEVQKLAISNIYELMRIYFSEENISFRELLKTMSPPTEVGIVEEKAVVMERKGLPPDEAAKLREKFYKMMEPFLDWSIELFQKSFIDALAKIMPGVKPPELAKATIPVTVTEVEPEPPKATEPTIIQIPKPKKRVQEEIKEETKD
jgi:predicted DNA-binding protein